MKPSHWPEYLDHVLAKSAAYGGETLAQHTWDVLEKLAALARLRPDLPALVGEPRLWHTLFWTCLLHDFGKAASGFQAQLNGQRWGHRHEVLSLVFLDWIAPALSPEEQHWIAAAIVSHHRDARTIQEKYADVDPDPLAPLLAEIDETTTGLLWRWIDECAADWIAALGLADLGAHPLPLLDYEEAVSRVCQQGAQRTRRWLRRYDRWLDDLNLPNPPAMVLLPILLRGLTTSADHMASAHLARLPEPIQEPWESLAGRILKPGQRPYAHQEICAGAAHQSALLVAPTGSGKTESALYWAVGDGSRPVPRLFYALPYQASMNAMFDRLKDEQKGFGEVAVGLQHGRAVQSLYARLSDQETSNAQAAHLAKLADNINRLNARPVKVLSPYQMLKALFQIRGFEALFSDYAHAAFIFDEIHAYDPERLALILTLVAYLRRHLGARFLVMSATFPQIIRLALAQALGEHATITADQTVFDRFRRHRLHLRDGELTDPASIAAITAEVQSGKQVLVCANTVRRAQDVRDLLRQAGLPDEQLLLIHSRYIIKDRSERERRISERCGVDVPLDQRRPLALIATQVVEVSLNIDLDTIYSDPAPLEALLQRFGRVNRQCKKGICPVYVFRMPTDGQGVYGRAKQPEESGHIVRVTLAELEDHDGQEIDEAAINGWLDRIYSDPTLQTQWEASYRRVADSAARHIAGLRPFNSDPQKEEEFEQLFDNMDVLPRRFEQEYLDHLARHDFIEASRYFVGISKRKYAQLARQGLVRAAADPDAKFARYVVNLEYTEDSGLVFDATGRDPDWD